ncbi:splicing factor PWI domain-containing protein [Iris pallida]|uniref:Splicing factor PWI domain-containing protein n=1 Tax=Iris pallida TaxID=29817 RepID=A0AAX6EQV9_IRIPA|nr:splicing factor PWI domain-containing protein [Iris pallida]
MATRRRGRGAAARAQACGRRRQRRAVGSRSKRGLGPAVW